MNVRGDMLNGYGIRRGGLVFALADATFAHAGNSCNTATVAAGCGIEYLSPVRSGDTLAAAEELRDAVNSYVGISRDVVVGEPGSIPRSLGKTQRVVDKRA